MARIGERRDLEGDSSQVDMLDLQYRGTALERKRTPLGPYRRLLRVVEGSEGGGVFSYGRCTSLQFRHSWSGKRPILTANPAY